MHKVKINKVVYILNNNAAALGHPLTQPLMAPQLPSPTFCFYYLELLELKIFRTQSILDFLGNFEEVLCQEKT